MNYNTETLKQFEERLSNLKSELREMIRKTMNLKQSDYFNREAYCALYNAKIRKIRNCQYKLNHIRQILFNNNIDNS